MSHTSELIKIQDSIREVMKEFSTVTIDSAEYYSLQHRLDYLLGAEVRWLAQYDY